MFDSLVRILHFLSCVSCVWRRSRHYAGTRQVFDGHNGISAAIYAKENLLKNVLSAIPQDISRDAWVQSLPRALVVSFVKTDTEFQKKGETFGTPITFVLVDGWTVTVASIGDSRCILDTQGGVGSLLTVDHRLEENVDERERVTASGGEVGRLNVFGNKNQPQSQS